MRYPFTGNIFISAHQILALVINMRCHDLLCIGRLVFKTAKVMYTMHILFVGNI